MTGRLRVGICGLGLIGSSVARGVTGAHDLVGVDPDQAAFAALADVEMAPAGAWRELGTCDLVLLAAPTAVNEALLRRMLDEGLQPRAVADLGSVKEPIDRLARTVPDFPFVGTHPMAGSERAGAGAGSADLFRNGVWPVVVHDDTDPVALQLVAELIGGLGGHPMPMSAPAHDRAVALVSHLPHLLAGALGAVAAASPDADLALGIAAGSFRDSSRVAASPPTRTAEFVTRNGANAAAAARAAARELDVVAALLDQGAEQAVAGWLTAAHLLRQRLDFRPDALTTLGPVTAAEFRDWMHDHRDTGARVEHLEIQHDNRVVARAFEPSRPERET